MKRLDRLIKEARASATWRGHDMKRFVHDDRYYIRAEGCAWSECKKCQMGVTIRVVSLPNQTDIGGEAVALNCKGN